MWNLETIKKIFSFEGEGFLGIQIIQKDYIYIVNVYSGCSIEKKRKLWSNLLKFKSTLPTGHLCVGGDFNATKKLGERKGKSVHYHNTEMTEFRYFIKEMKLTNLPAFGNKFTWFKTLWNTINQIIFSSLID